MEANVSERSVKTRSKPFTLLVLGDCGVGKTSLVARYATGHFPRHCLPTVEASTTEVKSHRPVQIVDTSGHPRYHASLSRLFADADAALLVYDVARRATFESLDARLMELQLLAKAGIEVAVVGNKADRQGSDGVVSPAEAQLWAEQHCLSHWTVSAKSPSAPPSSGVSNSRRVFVSLIAGSSGTPAEPTQRSQAPRALPMTQKSPKDGSQLGSIDISDVVEGGVDGGDSGCRCLPLLMYRPPWRKFWRRRRASVAPAA